jgi:MEDS: MEthanogen/methylotroph, DcmR Sensory domain
MEVSDMETDDRFAGFDGGILGQHRHVCAFFNSIDEQHRGLRSFVTDGFDRRDKAFHLVDPERRDEHLRWLVEAGVDVQGAMGTGQLEVRSWHEGPLRGDRFDQETWLASFEQVLQSGPATGYAQTRFLAHMEWALVDLPGVEDLIEFETHVNHVVPKYDDIVICTYDLTKFGANVVIDALRTHPVVIIGGLIQENPFFVPPDQFLLEIRERRSARESADVH